jgi:adenylosuccinate synthase
MPIDIIVGGQYGGEGKGLISAYLSFNDKASIVIKTGGPNSAHTVGYNGKRVKLRMLPTGACFESVELIVFPAGSLIHLDTLFKELEIIKYNGKIIVDPGAGIIEKYHVDKQKEDSFYNESGSTLTGTGYAMSHRVLRRLRLANSEKVLKKYLGFVPELLHQAINEKKKIIIEGSQGFCLSNYHGTYPYVTSRDTTAAAFLSQIGLPINIFYNIILVAKTFPTRNRIGNGVLPNEFTDNFLTKHKNALVEYGGGSFTSKDKKRRVGLFDFEYLRKAAWSNGATCLAVTGLDRLELMQKEKKIFNYYGSPKAFIKKIEQYLGIPVLFESWGPNIEDVKDFRKIY